MEYVESDEDSEVEPLDIDETLEATGEVVYINIKFASGQTDRLRVPVMTAIDRLNDGEITYSKILEQIDDAYAVGSDGHLQLPHHPVGQYYSTVFYALVGNITSIYVEPPVVEA